MSPPAPTLHTPRLRLRPFTEADADALYALHTNAHVLRYWDSAPWTDRARAERFIAGCRQMADEGTGVRPAIDRLSDGAFIGWCTLSRWNPDHRSASLGYCLDDAAWGHGYATEAAHALLQWAFDTLDLNRVQAEADTRNAASARVLEKLGFVREGTLREDCVVNGDVSDSWVFGLLRREWRLLSETGRRGERTPTFDRSDDLRGATYVDADLRGARFTGADLSGVVMRGVQVDSADIDAPWLSEGEFLRVNGVDVIPYVEAELDRRFPGREQRHAGDPDGLRAAWAVLESTWAATLERAAAMPAGTVDVSVDGEWSFAQTLRHLVLATDMWLGKAVLEIEQPFHPLGLADASLEDEDFDMSVLATAAPSYAEVLEARADRVATVRDFLADVTAEELAATRSNPHDPGHQETTLSCVHVILEEEWEHHRYAVRDLDAIAAS